MIYLDHAATTHVREEVLQAMKPFFDKKYGNASSLHSLGQEAKQALEDARKIIAKTINAEPEEMVFTSGGTESDNLAIKGVVEAGDHIITSAIEHPAVLETCRSLEKCKVDYISVSKEGFVDIDELKQKITEKTKIVSIMHANNEIGTIQPIAEIGKICREKNILFHTDAVQTFGKVPIDIKRMNIDLLSASSHKTYGPKGVGFLYVRKGVKIKPILHGGGHEFKLRSGTENIAGIVGFAKAAELAVKDMEKNKKHIESLRDRLINNILKIPNTRLNGSKENRLAGNVNVSFDFIEGEALVLLLNEKGIAASTGSACSTKTLKPSHVLLAIGLKPEQAHGSLRLTLGYENTEKEIDHVLEILPDVVKKLRKISPLGGKDV